MMKPKREYTNTYTSSGCATLIGIKLFYLGEIDWIDSVSRNRIDSTVHELAKSLIESGESESTTTRKLHVRMVDGSMSIRAIKVILSIIRNAVKQEPVINHNDRLKLDIDKPFGKSYLASHIHGYLKATAKNMATDTEIAKINSELQTLDAKIKQLEAKRTELEAKRKVATNDHDAVKHFGKLLEIAFRGEFVFVGARDEGYCKVLEFVRSGEIKVLPVSVFLVTEHVTTEHNVKSSATVPMPIIHVLNTSNVMIPVSDLTPKEIMQFLR